MQPRQQPRQIIDVRTKLLFALIGVANAGLLALAGFGLANHDTMNMVVAAPPLTAFAGLFAYVYRMRHDAATLWFDTPTP